VPTIAFLDLTQCIKRVFQMALEEYIKQVKETWSSFTLDLVNYQNKCRLIRGWDDLFTKCSENLNSLTAMKLSPYYKGEPPSITEFVIADTSFSSFRRRGKLQLMNCLVVYSDRSSGQFVGRETKSHPRFIRYVALLTLLSPF
jgi:hypothetical protein